MRILIVLMFLIFGLGANAQYIEQMRGRQYGIPVVDANSPKKKIKIINGTAGQILTKGAGNLITWATPVTGTDDQELTFDAATNVLTLEDGGTVNLGGYLDNTDDQQITDLSIDNTTSILTITLEDGGTKTVDLSGLGDNLGNHTATNNLDMNGYGVLAMSHAKYKNLAGDYVGFVGADDQAFGGSSGDFGSFVYGNNSFHISTNSTRKLTVASNGNVGIGTTTPTEKLEVVGKGKFYETVSGADAVNPTDFITKQQLDNSTHTGTTGSIFFAGDDGKPTEDNTNLFWDDVNKKLVTKELSINDGTYDLQVAHGTSFTDIRTNSERLNIGAGGPYNIRVTPNGVGFGQFNFGNIGSRNTINLYNSTEDQTLVITNSQPYSCHLEVEGTVFANKGVFTTTVSGADAVNPEDFVTKRQLDIFELQSASYTYATTLSEGQKGIVENTSTGSITITAPSGITFSNNGSSSSSITIAGNETVTFISNGSVYHVVNIY